ncbi:MAG: RDD family protein [Tatlockia sp.]|jgi:uncharacterized RDD family membrane protein YckC|nr:RDD family protein [Tatlockia sp.]
MYPEKDVLADRGTRLGAALIDSFAFIVPFGIMVAGDVNTTSALTGLGGLGVIALVIAQIYFLTVSGQTIGKKALNIRIIKRDTGENGGFVTNVLLRGIVNSLLGTVPLYYTVDTLFIFKDDRRCIHDLIANTKVVKV